MASDPWILIIFVVLSGVFFFKEGSLFHVHPHFHLIRNNSTNHIILPRMNIVD